MAKKSEYISLKEAAKISGYSADYVGQLIRAGKLPGKQIFSNVAWVTTEEAILEYQRQDKGGDKVPQFTAERLYSPEFLLRLYSAVAWFLAAFLVVFVCFLVYVFSASIERSIDRKYLEDAIKKEASL